MLKHELILSDQFSQLRLSEEFFFVIAHAIKLNFPINFLKAVRYILETKESKIQDIPFDEYCSFYLKRKIIKQLINAGLVKVIKPR